MVADITGKRVLYHPKFPGVSYGDAMLAAIVSALETENKVFEWVPVPRSIDPTGDPDVEAAYALAKERFARYREAIS
ncbi:MAG: hypothetical protein GWN18_18770, partial [Thermoplasmata archaeon]|nr:hypothetical protein [Thermoplasmata archaeon]NIS14173.1 hypothetical protein [Thermoplasmata archaeon]NIS22012.1 hypothetical protein [Thermoplasmata archaeon]NIT79871.1 hypothetical protein [Thermoplasmata archaeon]NIU51036.1 hypothetical protein [Thermoplasmata archaeon]